MNSFTILFLFMSLTLQAQNHDILKYKGCDNPKGKKMKNLCNSSIQKNIHDYAADKIKNYGDRVPQGKTYLTLSVSKTGEIYKITYSDFDNEKFAKFCAFILNEIKNDFNKYQIKLYPKKDKLSNEPIDFELKFPIQIIFE